VPTKGPTWVPLRAVITIQTELIGEHGGLAGPPRQGDLEAALGRPVNLHAYSESRRHCHVSRRPAGSPCTRPLLPRWQQARLARIIDVFLRMRRRALTADELDAVSTIQSLAAGDLTEDQLAEWIAANAAKHRR